MKPYAFIVRSDAKMIRPGPYEPIDLALKRFARTCEKAGVFAEDRRLSLLFPNRSAGERQNVLERGAQRRDGADLSRRERKP